MERQSRGIRGLGAGLLALASVMVLVSCATPTLTGKPTPTATPSDAQYAKAACPFSLGKGFTDGKNVLCGYLTVPEDRSNPASQRIKIAVATFKTPSRNPAPDPVFILQGGPGGRIIQDLAGAIVGGQLGLQAQFGNHDVVLVDQRGTGYSTPSLQCPQVVQLQYLTDQNLTPEQQVAQMNTAIDQCHTQLANAHINLGAYTTQSDAHDIHDLIDALGYKQVDLYGVSYGTRLALEIMRSFPQRVRSVILDSTVPPQLRLLPSIPSDTTRVFDTLFQGCAADPICNSKYPNLSTVFYNLYTALNAQPVTFQTTDSTTNKTYTVLFHGDDLVNLLFTSFYVTQAIPILPRMIYDVQGGNYQLASVLYGALMFDDSVSWGMYYSVECAEDVDFVTTSQLDTAGQAFPATIRHDQVVELEGEIPACKDWGVKPVSASESNPVTSAIPTLVMESQYDPITPPANGDLVAKTLSHSYTFLFPGVGHGAMLFNSCPTAVAIAFWSAPTQKPDASCIASMGEPQFS